MLFDSKSIFGLWHPIQKYRFFGFMTIQILERYKRHKVITIFIDRDVKAIAYRIIKLSDKN